jgi:ACS family hexuronate transporter-like MFS transporter
VRAKPPIRGLRYWILALLFLSTLINYVDRQVLSNLKSELSEQFHWSDRTYAHIVMAFQIAYAAGMSLSGLLMDRLGTRRGFAITITLWSVAACAHAVARGVFSFGICRFLLGLGEAGNWPGATKAVGEWFPPRERAFATGVWNTGSATGAVVAAFVVPTIAHYLGWQYAFLFTGALGFLWLLGWLAIYRTPDEHARMDSRELADLRASLASGHGATEPTTSRRELLRRPEVWGLVVARFLSDPVWWFFLFWLPGYLRRERGFELLDLAVYSWIPWFVADVGSVVGGACSSLLVRRGVEVLRARKIVMVAAAGLMPCAILAVRVESHAAMLALVSVAAFGHQCWASSILTLPADLFRGPVVASCSGLSGTGATLGGILATELTGLVVASEHLGYAPVFTWAGLMHPLAAILVLLLVRRSAAPVESTRSGYRAPLDRPETRP